MGWLEKQLSLSGITLGTMRFQDKELNVKQVVQLIEESYQIGITTHHSSFEYSSYQLYTKALRLTSCKSDIKHIVKLSSPHFGEPHFSATKLEDRIDNELKHLNIDCIDVLQWLVRSQPINDTKRLSILTKQKEHIEQTLQQLRAKGKIKSVFAFPYSVNFAKEVIKLNTIDGIISYLNKEELDYVDFANNHPFIAIRPLFAGQLLSKSNSKEKEIENCLNFVNSHSNVLTKIIGINTVDQLKSYSNLTK